MTDQNNPPAPVAGDTGADAGPVATVFLKDNGQYGIRWLRPVSFVEGKAALFAGPAIPQPAAVPDAIAAMNRAKALPVWDDMPHALHVELDVIFRALSAAPVPPSAPGAAVYVECRQCDHCGHYGINDSPGQKAACHNCDWTGDSPEQDKCPGCGEENCMAAACPECGGRYSLVAEEDIAAPVPPSQADPILDKPAMVGRGRFGVGVKWSTVIGAAQRLYEYEVTPSKEVERIKQAKVAFEQLRQAISAVPLIQDDNDAELLTFMIEEECRVVSVPVRGGLPRFRLEWPDIGEIQTEVFSDPRAAIRAAMATTQEAPQ